MNDREVQVATKPSSKDKEKDDGASRRDLRKVTEESTGLSPHGAEQDAGTAADGTTDKQKPRLAG